MIKKWFPKKAVYTKNADDILGARHHCTDALYSVYIVAKHVYSDVVKAINAYYSKRRTGVDFTMEPMECPYGYVHVILRRRGSNVTPPIIQFCVDAHQIYEFNNREMVQYE
jgi:hypothetical protein